MLLNPAQMVAIVAELALMIALPAALMVWWCRRRQVPATVPLIAAACYLVNLAVNVPLTTMLLPALGLTPLLLTALIALTYGLCEETARWASFRVGALRRNRTGDGGVAAGLGHGGTESIMIGLPYLFGTVLALIAPASLPAATTGALAGASPWAFVATGLDRLPAMAGQLVFALLIVLAYRRGRRFFWLAVAAHAGLDFVMFTLRDNAPLPVFVGAWALSGVIAAVIAFRLWRGLRAAPARRADQAPAQSLA